MALTLTHRPARRFPSSSKGSRRTGSGRNRSTEIERIEVFHGNRRVPLAELFRVSGDPSDGRIDFEGDLAIVHHIGSGMSGGEIHVHGDAGRHVGAEMTGGTIDVDGDAGDWVGGEMNGGVIHIGGSAGDHAGAAYPGSRRGMTDGTILIDGAAGDDVGRSMRRGLLAIGGSCGDDAGSA